MRLFFLFLTMRSFSSSLGFFSSSSDTHHLFFLPFISVISYYRGRGAFESLGAGLSMEPGDIAFKCNFATLGEEEDKRRKRKEKAGNGKKSAPTPLVVSRRADRAFEEAGPVLCSALDGLELPASRAWRCGSSTRPSTGPAWSCRRGKKRETRKKKRRRSLGNPAFGNLDPERKRRRRGPKRQPRPPSPFFELSDAVSGTDPLKDNLPLRRCVSPLPSSWTKEEEKEKEKESSERRSGDCGDGDEETKKRKRKNAETTAEIVNELSDEIRRILAAHPLNAGAPPSGQGRRQRPAAPRLRRPGAASRLRAEVRVRQGVCRRPDQDNRGPGPLRRLRGPGMREGNGGLSHEPERQGGCCGGGYRESER